jgi:hypothetical protein
MLRNYVNVGQCVEQYVTRLRYDRDSMLDKIYALYNVKCEFMTLLFLITKYRYS